MISYNAQAPAVPRYHLQTTSAINMSISLRPEPASQEMPLGYLRRSKSKVEGNDAPEHAQTQKEINISAFWL